MKVSSFVYTAVIGWVIASPACATVVNFSGSNAFFNVAPGILALEDAVTGSFTTPLNLSALPAGPNGTYGLADISDFHADVASTIMWDFPAPNMVTHYHFGSGDLTSLLLVISANLVIDFEWTTDTLSPASYDNQLQTQNGPVEFTPVHLHFSSADGNVELINPSGMSASVRLFFSVAPTPEPTSLVLFALGLAGLCARRSRT